MAEHAKPIVSNNNNDIKIKIHIIYYRGLKSKAPGPVTTHQAFQTGPPSQLMFLKYINLYFKPLFKKEIIKLQIIKQKLFLLLLFLTTNIFFLDIFKM